MKKITVINLKYPYGKSQTYMGGSTVAVIARFKQMGHEVDYLDLNFDSDPRDRFIYVYGKMTDKLIIHEKLTKTDIIAISVTGAPYLPSLLKLSQYLSLNYSKPILVGGQVIERLTHEQFQKIIHFPPDKNFTWYYPFNIDIKQIMSDADLAKALGCTIADLPNPYAISYIPAWECIGEERLKRYLSNEMAMVLSQGCHFQCAFCAASKAQKEKFKSLDTFSTDMRYLAQKAKEFGLNELQFYATSLDFFQNPKTFVDYLEELALIQKDSGIRFKIRCLACMSSYIKATELIGKDKLKDLIERSGLWCVGFGVDGADPDVWKAQKKRQNNLSEIKDSLDLALQMGLRSEILMVMGFPQDTFKTLAKCVINSIRYVRHWPNTMLRPYLAKEYVPGNDGWESGGVAIETFVSNPNKFYNLDFCAIGSKSTHPRFWHRTWSNLAYLIIIGLFTPFGKCVTSPLLPQGNSGLYGKIARLFNRIVPMDR